MKTLVTIVNKIPAQRSGLAFLIAVVAMTSIRPLTAEPAPPSGKRWEETGYGVSILPPDDANVVEYPGNDILLHLILTDDTTINLSIRESGMKLSIDQLVTEAIHQLASKHPSASILDQRKVELTNRPGAIIYFNIPTGRQGPWVLGQAYTQLGPMTFVVIRFEATKALDQKYRAVFEQVVQSLAIRDAKEVAARRMLSVSRGESWLKTVTNERLHALGEVDRWFRIIDAGKDVGYMRISTQPTQELGRAGIGMQVQSRMIAKSTTTDTSTDLFLSDDGNHEIWSIRSTSRGTGFGHSQGHRGQSTSRSTHSWAETGIRAYDKITVTRDKPTGIKNEQWRIPPQGYISQVHAILANPLLARFGWDSGFGASFEMGFYAYDPGMGKLSFQNLRIDRAQDGSTTIATRPSPDQAEYTSRLDRSGNIIDRVMPGGQTLLPTSKQQIQALWAPR